MNDRPPANSCLEASADKLEVVFDLAKKQGCLLSRCLALVAHHPVVVFPVLICRSAVGMVLSSLVLNSRRDIRETQARENMLSQCFRHTEAEIKADGSVGLVEQPWVRNIVRGGAQVVCPLM